MTVRPNRPANGVLAVALGCLLSAGLVVSCTSSGDSDKSSAKSTAAVPAGPNSTVPAGAGTVPKSGPGAGSQPGSDTYTAPVSAPYSTPGRSAAKVTDQKPVLDSLPGSASSSCAKVGDRREVRAGSVGMGNFESARLAFRKQSGSAEVPQIDMYVIPRHAKGTLSATVRIAPPSGKVQKVTSKRISELDVYRYVAVTLPIRSKGTYRFDVTAGPDKGCFTVAFGG